MESAGHHAAIVEVNSETDFVARNDGFQAFVREAAKLALDTDGTLEGLEAAHFPGATATVKETLPDLIATIGENMTLRRVAKLDVGKGVDRLLRPQPRSATASARSACSWRSSPRATSRSCRRSAARSPCMSPPPTRWRSMPRGVDPATLERESNILREKNAGKPDHVLAKIVESGLKSYYKEVTLLEQPFVHDGSKTVAQVLKEAEGKVGAPVKLDRLRALRARRGHREGRGPDFAAEVAAMSR